ncbi:hypothetical protein Dsin_004424 [Dipteronia sinensis]|uniref:RING-type domain-containing protein n=1 Tax=Dipteronia sinensis TaxID=43782 RepID=A0AAE0B9J7_9ROSI|nr:hypothetical protein Dsin_004424 [Dipteronia sinensis]
MQIHDCEICLDRWRCEGDDQICCLPCGHLFGFSCINKCIPQSEDEVSAKCPKCRMPFRSRDVRKIYGSPVTVLDEDLLDVNLHL